MATVVATVVKVRRASKSRTHPVSDTPVPHPTPLSNLRRDETRQPPCTRRCSERPPQSREGVSVSKDLVTGLWTRT